MTSEFVVTVVPLAGGQRQSGRDFAVKLRITAVDGRMILHGRGTRIIVGRRIGIDARALMLCAEHQLVARGDLPSPLIFLALIAADAEKRLRARAEVVCGRVRIVLPGIGARVLIRDSIGERAVRRV